jgi:hypothetical protein
MEKEPIINYHDVEDRYNIVISKIRSKCEKTDEIDTLFLELNDLFLETGVINFNNGYGYCYNENELEESEEY